MFRNSLRSLSMAVLALAAAPARADVVDVYVYNFEFSVNQPGQPIVDAVISVGDTVRWTRLEGDHTTTAVAGIVEQWDGTVSSGSPTFSHTFTNTGTFWYYCQPHGFDNGNQTAGGMSGKVTVLPAGSGACCLPNGTCAVTTAAACLQQGGNYQGKGSSCRPDPCASQPITVTLPAVKDNILYESTGGTTSNGAGRYIYAGNGSNGLRRRGVIQFDLASIPAGAQVQDVQLRLFCGQSQGQPFPITVHRLNTSWGEGTSNANGDEGSGTTATTGDATWVHRYYPGTNWATLGGDFAAIASASTTVATGSQFITWSSPGLVADVQAWVAAPAMNSGWILRGDETSGSNAKRFDSRQGDNSANYPRIQVTYVPGAPTGACCLPDGSCTSVSMVQCMAQGGTYQGDGVMCSMVVCPAALTPFVDPLPRPAVVQPVTGVPGGAAHYQIAAQEVFQQLHRDLPPTRVWGYAGTYPGPTIEARSGQPVTVTWVNDLRDASTGQLRTTHVFPIDTCMHGPDMTGQVPVTVTHLHGGHVPQSSDGYPEDTFPPGGQSAVYDYPNNQAAGTLWYHDHALGITRLNVYMGLAGFYLLRDDAEDALNIPRGEFEIPLAIQDRSFLADGSLMYHGMWHDHFFGDVILVNGKVWPFLEVKRGKYRFRALNGCNSRVLRLALSNGATFWQIGTDLGLLSAPEPRTELLLAPGERADLVLDFEPYTAGTEIILTNGAPAPFPGQPGVGVVPDVMKFVVLAQAGDTDPLPPGLVPVTPIPEEEAVVQRNLLLRQVPNTMCPGHMDGMWTIDGRMWHEITELPRLDTAEIWAWDNRSPVTHPMHMHLVAFQVLDHQPIDAVTGLPTGPRAPPGPDEGGWKDTVRVPPSTITRVIARFEDYEGLFAYHCHILEHEDHEMMRQFRTIRDTDADGVEDALDNCVALPNPTQADCDGDGVGDVCELAAGAEDCNGNAVPDACDVAAGTSRDDNLNGVPDECDPDVVLYCFGDGSGTVCPCGNASAIGQEEGCLNSFGTGGRLRALGTSSLSADTLVLQSSGMPNSSALYFQGTTRQDGGQGSVFGDGLRCAGGSVIRLATLTNVGSASQYPSAGLPAISVRGMVSTVGRRTYQVWYRNAASFCTAATYNLTNGAEVLWRL